MSFDAARFQALVAERRLPFGTPLVVRTLTGSTNDDALAAAREGAPEGALFVADAQTEGRGRRGNAWYAEPGCGLLFSLLLRPLLPLARSSALSLVAGLAVRACVSRLLDVRAKSSHPVLVKWPNDIVVAGRKLCGVLVESQVRGSALGAVVVGVGLNVGLGNMPDELRNRATSLATLGLHGVEPELVLAEFVEAFAPRLAAFCSDAGEAVAELDAYDALRGKRVQVSGVEGVGAGIDSHGRLLVMDDAGRRHAVTAGEVAGVPCDPLGNEA